MDKTVYSVSRSLDAGGGEIWCDGIEEAVDEARTLLKNGSAPITLGKLTLSQEEWDALEEHTGW